jgi:hypothetical protein
MEAMALRGAVVVFQFQPAAPLIPLILLIVGWLGRGPDIPPPLQFRPVRLMGYSYKTANRLKGLHG